MESIRIAKDGREITVDNGFVCLGGEKESCRIEALNPSILEQANALYPGASYKAGRILLNKEEGEKAQALIKAFWSAKEEKERHERLVLETSLPQYRVLIKSGHYYSEENITTVVLQPEKDQNKYADWLKGWAVMDSIIAKKIKIAIKNSPTAQAIVTQKPSGYQYSSGESAMWIITPKQEGQIIAEYKAAVEAKKAKAKAEKEEKQAEKDAIFAKARSTGEKQALRQWMTEGCTENLNDCSFDSAVEWAMPDGTTKITYTHCH
jgi:hypothetical protein